MAQVLRPSRVYNDVDGIVLPILITARVSGYVTIRQRVAGRESIDDIRVNDKHVSVYVGQM
jgi:hypothetical protein